MLVYNLVIKTGTKTQRQAAGQAQQQTTTRPYETEAVKIITE